MEDLAVGRDLDRPGRIEDAVDVFTNDFLVPAADPDDPTAVDAPDVLPGDADEDIADRDASHSACGLGGLQFTEIQRRGTNDLRAGA